jgi:hypothetical protein
LTRKVIYGHRNQTPRIEGSKLEADRIRKPAAMTGAVSLPAL